MIAFTFSSVFAQNSNNDNEEENGFTKGNFIVYGGISYTSVKANNQFQDDENRFSFTPRIGYFVSDNIAVGVSIGIATDKRTGSFGNEFKINSFGAGGFGRYYFTPANKFSVFTELELGYVTTKSFGDTGFSSTEMKSNGFSGSFSPGVNYFISNSFTLEASFGLLSYISLKDDMPNAEATEIFRVGLDLSNVNLGLNYRF